MQGEKFAALMARARHLLLRGALPYARGQIFAGPDRGHHVCRLCELQIRARESIYEVDIERRGETQTVYLHPECHSIWRLERDRLRRERIDPKP